MKPVIMEKERDSKFLFLKEHTKVFLILYPMHTRRNNLQQFFVLFSKLILFTAD